MAEEWLEKIVSQIKQKDHEVAEKDIETDRRAAQIAHDGPIFWKSFTDFLSKYIGEMREQLQGDATAGRTEFGIDASGSIVNIQKSAYPYVNFNARADFQQQLVDMRYIKHNPHQPVGTAAPFGAIPCRFELPQHHKVFLHLDGKEFHESHEAAKYLVEKLFTI